MGAYKQTRRKLTARKVAEKYGVSERTVRRAVAEPRSEYLTRAKARQLKALGLREAGKSYAEISHELGVTEVNARSLVHRARKRAKTDARAA